MAEEVVLKQQAQDMRNKIWQALSRLGKCTGVVIYNVAQITFFDMLEPKRKCKHSRLPDGISISYTRNISVRYLSWTY